MENIQNLDIIYQNKSILQYPYDNTTTLDQLKTYISNKMNIDKKKISLNYNKKDLIYDDILLTSFIITTLGKISTEKIRVKILPQINLSPIKKIINFLQIENNNNKFEIEIDICSIISEFINDVGNFFRNKLEEFNYKIKEYHFFDSVNNEINIFNNQDKDYIFKSDIFSNSSITFYFLLKDLSICFYKNNVDTNNDIKNKVNIRKNTISGQSFNIIIQTYNSYVKQIEVNHDMTVSELKKKIEEEMNISESYQELIYLVYKLKNERKLSDYYIRPQGVVFLRGFYFPLIFTDYFSKDTKVIEINIAEQVFNVKKCLINILNLGYDNFKLISNGKELEEEKYLIDYNIQKFQNIYIK